MTLTFSLPRPGARRTMTAPASCECCQLTMSASPDVSVVTFVTRGGVESYLSASVADDWLPAWSVHAPVSEIPALSGPWYCTGLLHDAMPEVASVPANLTETGWLYQPCAFGGRAGAASVEGGVASYFSDSAAGALTLPAMS